MSCARCGKEIVLGGEETCWYCDADLCGECWEARGHCGHPEADDANRWGLLAGKHVTELSLDDFLFLARWKLGKAELGELFCELERRSESFTLNQYRPLCPENHQANRTITCVSMVSKCGS